MRHYLLSERELKRFIRGSINRDSIYDLLEGDDDSEIISEAHYPDEDEVEEAITHYHEMPGIEEFRESFEAKGRREGLRAGWLEGWATGLLDPLKHATNPHD